MRKLDDRTEELATLRHEVRALRLMMSKLPGILAGLYELDGRLAALAGLPPEGVGAVIGQHWSNWISAERRDRFVWMFERAKQGITSKIDYPIRDGIYEATCLPIRYAESDPIRYVLIYTRNVTSERAALAAVEAKVGRDSLTGLPRRTLLDQFVQALFNTKEPFHLLFIDLDRFKHVNDTYGHPEGDALLERVSGALQSSIRAGDLAVRLGGDEFVVVLTKTDRQHDAARRMLGRIMSVVEDWGAGASIGMASYPQDGDDINVLLKKADEAMYQAKVAGGEAVHLVVDGHDQSLGIRTPGAPFPAITPSAVMKAPTVVPPEMPVDPEHPRPSPLPPSEEAPSGSRAKTSPFVVRPEVTGKSRTSPKFESAKAGRQEEKMKELSLGFAPTQSAMPSLKPGQVAMPSLRPPVTTPLPETLRGQGEIPKPPRLPKEESDASRLAAEERLDEAKDAKEGKD